MDVFTKYCYTRNKLETYSCITVGARVSGDVAGSSWLDHIRSLVERRQILRTTVVSGEVRQIEIDIEQHVEIEDHGPNDPDDIVSLVNRNQETVFRTDLTTRSLWRFVIHGRWLLFLVDHTLADGSTAAFIVEDLVKLANGEAIGEDIQVPNPNPLYIPSLWFVLKTLAGEIFNKDWRAWNVGPKDVTTFHTLKRLIKLDIEKFQRLDIIMKREKVSFTTLLVYFNIQAMKQESIKVSVPVNLRPFLDQKFARASGLCVSAIELDLFSKKIDWDYGREIQSQLDPERQRESAQRVGMLNYINVEKYLKKKKDEPRGTTLEVSNLGKRATVKGIEEFVFSQPNNHTGPLFTNDVISSHKSVSIMVNGAPETAEVFDAYAQRLESLLLNPV